MTTTSQHHYKRAVAQALPIVWSRPAQPPDVNPAGFTINPALLAQWFEKNLNKLERVQAATPALLRSATRDIVDCDSEYLNDEEKRAVYNLATCGFWEPDLSFQGVVSDTPTGESKSVHNPECYGDHYGYARDGWKILPELYDKFVLVRVLRAELPDHGRLTLY